MRENFLAAIAPVGFGSTKRPTHALRDAILDGRFAAGTKLPPERDLAVEFQVNRTSIREAIKVLEGQGLVMVRQGDGATVQPLVEASLDVLGPMIFHGGRMVRGTWKKDSLDTPITLSAKSGELTVPAGHVWIELVPAGNGDVTFAK